MILTSAQSPSRSRNDVGAFLWVPTPIRAIPRRAYELQVIKYQQMALEYPPVLAAQRLLVTLQLGYTEALNQEWRAAIALQNYALMNGLGEPVSTGSDSTTINLPTALGPNQ